MTENNRPVVQSDLLQPRGKIEMIENMLSVIVNDFNANSISFTQAEEASIAKLQVQLEKLGKHKSNISVSDSLRDTDDFSDKFLESFTTCAFSAELDALRNSEELTNDDLATLAETIRSFGRGMSSDQRALYKQSLET